MKIAIIAYLSFVFFLFSPYSFGENNTIEQSPSLHKKQSLNHAVININEAELATLVSLKGIGKKKAQAILKYRSENGAFTTIDELINVQGIGKSIIKENKSRIKI